MIRKTKKINPLKIAGLAILIIVILAAAFFCYILYLFNTAPPKIITENGKYFIYENHSYTLMGNCTIVESWCWMRLCDMPYNSTYYFYDSGGNLMNCSGPESKNCGFLCMSDYQARGLVNQNE